MPSLYSPNALTRRGQDTRSKILLTLAQRDGLTRNEIVTLSALTYEQVRNQTQNLIEDRKIRSKIESGERRYYLAAIAIFFLFVPAFTTMIERDSISDDSVEMIDS